MSTPDTKPEDKSVSRSVSMLESRWQLVDDHAPTTPGKDRSGYITNLVEADLRAVGKLPKVGATVDDEFLLKVRVSTERTPALKAQMEKLMKSAEGTRRRAAVAAR